MHGIFETGASSSSQQQASSNPATAAAMAAAAAMYRNQYTSNKDAGEMDMDEEEYMSAYQQQHQGGEEFADDDGGEEYDGEVMNGEGEKELGECGGESTSIAAQQPRQPMMQRRGSDASQNSNQSSSAGGASSSTNPHTDYDMMQAPPGAMDTVNSFCNLCKRKFYSYNFLRNHAHKIHGMTLPKRSLSGTPQPTNTGLNSGLANSAGSDADMMLDDNCDPAENNAPSEIDDTNEGNIIVLSEYICTFPISIQIFRLFNMDLL